MRAVRQRTLSSPVELTGVGLHSGAPCRIVIRPVSEHSGIIFRRSDLETDVRGGRKHLLIPAHPANVARTHNGTTLANSDGVSVMTVEHLMAAFALLSVDNAFVDVCGEEIPILDGSAAPFVNALTEAGLTAQNARREEVTLEKPIEVRKGERFIRIEPADRFRLDVAIAFEDCMIGRQSLSISLSDPAALDRLAQSRTFCQLREIEALRSAGLVKGGSLENSLVVDGQRLYADQELRDPEEFVLHKALDLLGDLYLLGGALNAAVTAEKPGHDLNVCAAQAIAEQLGSRKDEAWAAEAATA